GAWPSPARRSAVRRPLLAVRLSQFLERCIAAFIRRACPAQARGAEAAAGKGSRNGRLYLGCSAPETKMIQHHCTAQNCSDWIDNAFAGDVGRRTVNRLEH